jgi:hypothetical protein
MMTGRPCASGDHLLPIDDVPTFDLFEEALAEAFCGAHVGPFTAELVPATHRTVFVTDWRLN